MLVLVLDDHEEKLSCIMVGGFTQVGDGAMRGIGPECIKYFGDVEAIAAEVRSKPEYRSLDAEWLSSAELEPSWRQ